jgi:hypothetical protein
VLDSVLDSRIDQLIAITLPTDRSRIDVLEAIKKIDSPSMRVASFSDYLIDHIANLSLELSTAQIALEQAQGQTSTRRSRQDYDDDYAQSLALLRSSRNNLSVSITDLIDQNRRLRRDRKRQRSLLLRQNQLLQRFSENMGLGCENFDTRQTRRCGTACAQLEQELDEITSEFHDIEADLQTRVKPNP